MFHAPAIFRIIRMCSSSTETQAPTSVPETGATRISAGKWPKWLGAWALILVEAQVVWARQAGAEDLAGREDRAGRGGLLEDVAASWVADSAAAEAVQGDSCRAVAALDNPA